MANSINFADLPLPNFVTYLSYKEILQAWIDELVSLDNTYSALVASDPGYKLIQVGAYREFVMRQDFNDNALASTLAKATGTGLDILGAGRDVERKTIDPGDPSAIPPVDPTYELDDDYRKRIALAFDGLSAAGPIGAYEFYALSADATVKDVYVKSPSAGVVTVSVLSAVGNGVADPALLAIVTAALNDQDVRPLTDNDVIQSATVIPFFIDASIYIYDGVGQADVLANSQASAQKFVDDMHKIGRDITLSGITAALKVDGVQDAVFTAPANTITISDEQVAYCTGITIVIAGTAE